MTHYRPKQLLINILTAMTVLFGGSMAVSADTVTEGFDTFKAGWNSGWTAWEVVMPEGWDYIDDNRAYTADKDTYKTKAPSVCSDGNNTGSYLITPKLTGDFSFYIRNYTKNYQATVKAYACTFADGTLTLGDELGSKTLSKTNSGSPAWESVTFTTSSATRVALLISRAYFDDFTYTPAEGGGDNPGSEPGPEPDPVPVMVVSTTTVNFGKVVANATQDITISNTGTAELTATIASDSEEFTVSKTAVTVAAGAEETLAITYLYNAKAYGAHTATVTVTPNVGEAATIALSAYVQNPNVWTEDFSANALPEGWKAGDCWTFSDGVAHGKYVYNANNYLTTPILIVSGTADQLTFQARQTGVYPDIKIEQSLNGGEWTALKTIKSDDIKDEWQTYTVDGLAAGSYQLRFLSDSYDLDNFEGFRLNLEAPILVVSPTTDAAFGKVSAQPVPITYTITNDGTGTLTGTIASDNAAFTVSKSTFTLTAGESTTFDITLVFDEQYGPKAAAITIHPTAEGLSDVVINATATTLDPNIWVEDFEDGVIPDNWSNSGWTAGTLAGFEGSTQMALAPQSNTAAALITPRLQAKKGDVLSWDAYLKWSDEPLLVEYSTDDQATWTTIYDYKAEDDGQGDKYYKEMSFTAPADGYYYLRFTAKFQNGVDNFCGFSLAPVTQTTETWYVSYVFTYKDADGNDQNEVATEPMEILFSDGNKVSFNFPNPINGNAWMRGTKDADGNLMFPNGQYIGKFGSEQAYYCGSNGETLTDIKFSISEAGDSYLCSSAILINSSTTAISAWGIFTTVLVSKDNPTTGISEGFKAQDRQFMTQRTQPVYDLQGRRVSSAAGKSSLKPGLYIINGRKVMMK